MLSSKNGMVDFTFAVNISIAIDFALKPKHPSQNTEGSSSVVELLYLLALETNP